LTSERAPYLIAPVGGGPGRDTDPSKIASPGRSGIRKGNVMRKRILLFCVLSLAVFGCARQGAPTMLKVAVCPTSPPNLYQENGRYVGLDL